ncbi:MAG: hypothetical protein M9904_02435 [Chitinophagaceae bacterium]|nr:hypothetical protein [Chitinophagaceae bacterium]
MFAPSAYPPFEASLSNAKTVVSLGWLYEEVRNHMGKLLVLVLTFFLGLPLVFAFGFWLRLKRRELQKNMRKAPPAFKTHNDYRQFKTHLAKMDSLMPALETVAKYNLKKAPLHLRYTLNQMQKSTSTLVTYHSWLTSRLNLLNNEQFKSESKVFKLVPEKELWEKRNAAYQYWM